MKHLQKLLLIVIFFSCTSKDLIIERGVLTPEAYINESIGIVINYDDKIFKVGTTDSLNVTISFDQSDNKKINFKNRTEKILLVFYNQYSL